MLSVPTISTLTGWGEKGKQRNKAGGNGGSGKLVHAGAGGSLLAAWRMHPRAARVCRIRRRATQQRRRCAGAPEWWTPLGSPVEHSFAAVASPRNTFPPLSRSHSRQSTLAGGREGGRLPPQSGRAPRKDEAFAMPNGAETRAILPPVGGLVVAVLQLYATAVCVLVLASPNPR
jgi:hypothetical protein